MRAIWSQQTEQQQKTTPQAKSKEIATVISQCLQYNYKYRLNLFMSNIFSEKQRVLGIYRAKFIEFPSVDNRDQLQKLIAEFVDAAVELRMKCAKKVEIVSRLTVRTLKQTVEDNKKSFTSEEKLILTKNASDIIALITVNNTTLTLPAIDEFENNICLALSTIFQENKRYFSDIFVERISSKCRNGLSKPDGYSTDEELAGLIVKPTEYIIQTVASVGDAITRTPDITLALKRAAKYWGKYGATIKWEESLTTELDDLRNMMSSFS